MIQDQIRNHLCDCSRQSLLYQKEMKEKSACKVLSVILISYVYQTLSKFI